MPGYLHDRFWLKHFRTIFQLLSNAIRPGAKSYDIFDVNQEIYSVNVIPSFFFFNSKSLNLSCTLCVLIYTFDRHLYAKQQFIPALF